MKPIIITGKKEPFVDILRQRLLSQAHSAIYDPDFSINGQSAHQEQPCLIIFCAVSPDTNLSNEILSFKTNFNNNLPFLVLVSQGNVRSAVEYIQLGAVDFIEWDHQAYDLIIKHIQNSNLSNTPFTEKNKESYVIEQNNLFRQIIEHTETGVMVIDRNSNILVWNKSMERITGFKSAQVIGKTPYEVHPDFFCNQKPQIISDLLNIKTIKKFDFRFTNTQTGKTGWYTSTCKPLINKSGQPSGIFSTVTDIGKRKQTEHILDRSQQRLRQIIDLIPQYVSVKDDQGKYILANKAVARLYGVQTRQMAGMEDRYLSGNSEELLEYQELEDGIILKKEVIKIQTDEKRIIETLTIPFITIDEKRSARLCIATDITQSRANDELIRKLSMVVEKTLNSIIITDPEGRIEYANSRFCKTTGYSKEELIGVIPKHIYTNKTQETQLKEIWKTICSGKSWVGEIKKKNKKGETILSYAKITLIENNQGKIINILVVEEDITALKENEHQLKTIINNIPDLILYKDGEKKWIKINKTASLLFGLEGNYQGKSASELVKYSEFNHNVILSADSTDELAFINRSSYTFQKEIPLPTGEIRIFEFKKVPVFNPDQSRKGLVVIGRDITELIKRSQDLLKAKERAEQNDRLKTVFLQNISHEIRTPMNAIVGFSKILNQVELSVEKRKQFSSIIVNNSNQLLSVLTNILTISSLETHQEIIFERKTNITELMRSLYSTFLPLAEKKMLEFILQMPQKFNEYTITDKQKVWQILANIIDNAIKFTDSGQIEAGFQIIPSLHGSSSEEILFYVRDTGIGIAQDWQDKVFDRFVQIELKENRKYGGNGIGLSVAKGFTELLGGKIWLESTPGHGSTFRFTLPFKPFDSKSNASRTDDFIEQNASIRFKKMNLD